MAAAEINPFEEALIEQEALLASGPVDNDLLHVTLNALETTGYEQIGKGELKTARFAEALHQVFSNAAELEVVPPLSEEQQARFTGKIATYATMMEATATKPPRRTQTKTDTDKTPTDKPKR